jgi:hypothetical protein
VSIKNVRVHHTREGGSDRPRIAYLGSIRGDTHRSPACAGVHRPPSVPASTFRPYLQAREKFQRAGKIDA